MAEFRRATSGAIVAEALVLDLTPPSKIGTGICFLDHMVDQFTSHGMLGVTLRCGVGGDASASASAAAPVPEPEPETVSQGEVGGTKFFAPLQDYATGMSGRPHDRDIFAACGSAMGLALRRVVDEVAGGLPADALSGGGPAAALFCSPLDESFAEATVDLRPIAAEHVGRCVATLEPYGVHCGRAAAGATAAAGRRWIGRYRTELTPVFWQSLAAALGADISLKKVRGGNAHHQLESTFKAFARAFRAALDRMVDPTGSHGCAAVGDAPLPLLAAPEPRRAERRRATKETTIEVCIVAWYFTRPVLTGIHLCSAQLCHEIEGGGGGDAGRCGSTSTPPGPPRMSLRAPRRCGRSLAPRSPRRSSLPSRGLRGSRPASRHQQRHDSPGGLL